MLNFIVNYICLLSGLGTYIIMLNNGFNKTVRILFSAISIMFPMFIIIVIIYVKLKVKKC
jgi:hypothetical protein